MTNNTKKDKPIGSKVIGILSKIRPSTVFKFFALGLVIFVYCILMLRICTFRNYPAEATKLLWTEASIESYLESPDSFSAYSCTPEGYSYFESTGEETYIASVSFPEITEDGKFSFRDPVWYEASNEYQITVRYNNSTIKALMQELGMTEQPKGESFAFFLRDDAGRIYTEYKYSSHNRGIYNYRRAIFEGVDLDTIRTLELCVVYVGFASYDQPYNSIMVYDSHTEPKKLKLSLKDIPQSISEAEELKQRPGYFLASAE